MSVHSFVIPPEAVLREYSLYIVVSIPVKAGPICVYTGKTGDNRKGCNPVVSRAGNHFSYNKIHSQVRNKISEKVGTLSHEKYSHNYFFTHFRPYDEEEIDSAVAEINELERYLLKQIKQTFTALPKIILLNEYKGKLKKRDEVYHTKQNMQKIRELLETAFKAASEPPRRAR